MEICENNVIIQGIQMEFGMSYFKAFDKLTGLVYANLEPDENGLGHLIIRDINFYNLKGSCNIYFNNDGLRQIDIEPDWTNYDFRDDDGELASYNESVKMLASLSRDGLRAGIGRESLILGEGIFVFLDRDLKIVSSITNDNENYLVSITSCDNELKINPGPVGYALVTKKLFDSECVVGYCYREAPDRDDDTGWRFFLGDETDEYLSFPGNVGIYNISTIISRDPSVKLIMRSKYGSAFERLTLDGPFRVVND